MAIEGTGIKEPSKKASRMAMATYRVDPLDKLNRDIERAFKNLSNQESTGAVKETGRGMGDTFNPFKDRVDASDQIENRPSFFSPDGGAFDRRNNVQLAAIRGSDATSVSGDVSGDIEGFNNYLRDNYATDMDDRRYKNMPATLQRIIRESYNDFKNKDQIQTGEGTLLNQKPSFVEQTKNLAGSIFNRITGTQPAAASQIPGGIPTGTQFTSSNLDAARTPTGDTSFASYRMAGQPSGGGQQQQEGSGIVTPFSQTSMGRGEDRKITPFSETSMGKGEPIKVTPFRQTSMGNKTVTVDGQKVAARQTVASLPSDYKQTEAREFAKAAAFQQAKKNPNVKVGVDSKGQPTATAANDSGRARAQAAAYNRKLSGKSISQTKAANRASMKASAAARNASFQARKKAGTLSRSERTASGQRARNKARARARAQSAARKRRAKKKGKKKCDIFLKYNISPLTNMNLIRDDLAEVAYFVKEIQK